MWTYIDKLTKNEPRVEELGGYPVRLKLGKVYE
jgi:hypothetical protein